MSPGPRPTSVPSSILTTEPFGHNTPTLQTIGLKTANRLKLNADKNAAALWAGSCHGPAVLGIAGLSLQLRSETVVASDEVRVLAVTMTSDLPLDKHDANVCATCFYWLRQLRRVRCSLDAESAATPVPAFVTSRMDYCNAILAGASKSTTDKLHECRCSRRQRHAEVRSWTHQCTARRAALAGRSRASAVQAVCNGSPICLQHKAPQYMKDCCIHISDIARRQHCGVAGCRQLLVPRHRRSMFGRRAFSVAGPTAWNSLPDYL